MPNRIIRDGLLSSDKFDSLGWQEQCFYTRLLLIVDDFGRFDARPLLLLSRLYPLRINSVRPEDIHAWLTSCNNAGLLDLYEVDGKEYLQIANFRQQIRSKKSKWPAPEEEKEKLHSRCVADDAHVHSICTADAERMHTKTETETKTKTNAESEARPRARAQEAPPPESVEEVVRYMRNQPDVMLNAGQLQLCAESFYGEYGAIGWTLKGQPVRDWRKLAHSYMGKWQTYENRPRGKGGGGGGKKWNIPNAATVDDNRYKGL